MESKEIESIEATVGRREGVDADIRKEELEYEGGDLCLVYPICRLKQPGLLVFRPGRSVLEQCPVASSISLT